MQVYEIVVDGELATDLTDPLVPLRRRNSGGATILTVPVLDADSLSHTLTLLESLGIGVTAVRQVDEAGRDPSGSD